MAICNIKYLDEVTIAISYFLKNKFSPNLLNGLICEARARAKQSLLRRSWPLQSDREISGNRQN